MNSHFRNKGQEDLSTWNQSNSVPCSVIARKIFFGENGGGMMVSIKPWAKSLQRKTKSIKIFEGTECYVHMFIILFSNNILEPVAIFLHVALLPD